MFTKLIGLRLALCVGALVISADVGARPARCEGCADWQFVEKAKSMGAGEHVITSFSTGKIAVFAVNDASTGSSDAPVVWSAHAKPVPPELKAAFDQIESLYRQYREVVLALAEVRAEDLDVAGLQGADAFQVMSDISLKLRLGDPLAPAAAGLGDLARAVERLDGGLFGLSVPAASAETTVMLADGSSVAYRISANSATGQYLQDRSRTREGNAIPEANTARYQGRWTGSPDEIRRLAVYMRDDLHVPVNNLNNAGATGMDCRWNGSTLACDLRRD